MMTTNDTLVLLMAALALLFSFSTVLFSILAYATVIGLKNSTHNIQYMPAEEFADKFNGGEEVEEIEEKTGLPITDPIQKEKLRQKQLLESFAEMYKDSED